VAVMAKPTIDKGYFKLKQPI